MGSGRRAAASGELGELGRNGGKDAEFDLLVRNAAPAKVGNHVLCVGKGVLSVKNVTLGVS